MICIFAKYKEQLVQLPVNPEQLKVTGDAENETSTVVNLGQLSDIGFPNLKELSIESFFPYRSGAGYINTNGAFEGPDFYIDFFEKIKNNRDYFRLIITDTPIDMLVSIEGFEYTYQYGTDDVDYTLNLKEYKEHKVRTLKVTNSGANSNANYQQVQNTSASNYNSDRSVEKSVPSTYTVKTGDSLWKIAKSLLGDGSRWSDIYNYKNNKSIIGANPNLIRPGQVLSIPV